MNNSESRKRKLEYTTNQIHMSSGTGGMNIQMGNGAMMVNCGGMNIQMGNGAMMGNSGSMNTQRNGSMVGNSGSNSPAPVQNSSSFDSTFVNFNYGTITMNCGYPSSRSTYTNASVNSSVAASEIGYAETAGYTRAATFGNRHAVTTVNTYANNTSTTYVSTEPLQKRAKTEIKSAASKTNLSGRKKAAGLLVDDDECIICYETYKKIEDNMASLPCGHYYHKNCLDKWLVVENTCPVCRNNALTGESV